MNRPRLSRGILASSLVVGRSSFLHIPTEGILGSETSSATGVDSVLRIRFPFRL